MSAIGQVIHSQRTLFGALPTPNPPFRERYERAADAHWISSAIGLDKAVVDHCGQRVVWEITRKILVAAGEASAITALALGGRHCASAPRLIALTSPRNPYTAKRAGATTKDRRAGRGLFIGPAFAVCRVVVAVRRPELFPGRNLAALTPAAWPRNWPESGAAE